ncbi:hypothetical protein BH10BAC6_BH10BAC6_05860 [soil metagenome]
MRTYEQFLADVQDAMGMDDVDAMNRLAAELQQSDTPQFELLLQLALCWIMLQSGSFTSAFEHGRRALSISEELNDEDGLARAHGMLGTLHLALMDSPSALEHFHRALELNEKLGDQRRIASTIANLGIIHANRGNYPTALEYYHKALEIQRELNNAADVAITISCIGTSYAKFEEYQLALQYYQQSLDIERELNISGCGAVSTGNIGTIYLKLGDFEAALDYYRRALVLYDTVGKKAGVAVQMGNIIGAHISRGAFEDARAALLEFDTIPVTVPSVILNRERCRAEIFEHDGDLDAAQAAHGAALEIARTHNMPEAEVNQHKLLRDLAQKRNDFASYVEHNNEYTRINEIIRGKDATQKLATMESERKMETERREREKERAILHSTLPKHIADRVAKGETINDHYDIAAVLFLDIVGFTALSSTMSATNVVALLERVFSVCDSAVMKHSMTKIKTIGDSYMAVAFDTIENAAHAALELASAITEVPVRIGIHCGPVVAGVLGKERMQYDVWGDTVNIASRMESTGEAGRIHISEAFANEVTLPIGLQTSPTTESESFRLTLRGEVDVKGKGTMKTYWLERA